MSVGRNSLLDLLGRRGAATRRQEPVPFGKILHSPERILVIPTRGPQGFPFALPSLALLRDSFPAAKLHVLVDDDSDLLFRTDPLVDSVHRLEPASTLRPAGVRSSAPGRALGSEQFDIALWLDSEVDPERRIAVSQASHAARIGRFPDAGSVTAGDPFDGENPEEFFNCLFRFGDEATYPPLVQLALTRRVTRMESALPQRLEIEPRLVEKARQLVHFWKPQRETYLIVIDPGRGIGGSAPAAKKLALIADLLQKTYPSRILVLSEPTCAPAIAEFSQEIARLDPLQIPQNGFMETLALLSQADLVVSGNTALFHCAWVLGVPSIALFGRFDEERYVPPDQGPSVVIRSTEGVDADEFLRKVNRLLTSFVGRNAPRW